MLGTTKMIEDIELKLLLKKYVEWNGDRYMDGDKTLGLLEKENQQKKKVSKAMELMEQLDIDNISR